MRKEVIWAAAIGIAFGLVIAFGAWRINSKIKPIQKIATSTPRPEPTSEFKITLDKPENDDVITEDFVRAAGITKPLSWIVVSGEDGDHITKSQTNGTFEQDVSLIPGINQIKISAFDEVGNPSFEKVLVVFSSAFQTKTLSSTPSSEIATSDASIRQKVQQKVEAALNKPKAYIGVVTDIAESTIQIKTTKGEIKQISINSEDISVIKSSGTTSKSVKISDIAIGDFIAAMGYVNTSSVLMAQRILITSPITDPKITVNFGEVKENNKSITITSKIDSQEVEITPNKKTIINNFVGGEEEKIKQTDIKESSLVVFVDTGSVETPNIRSLFVVKNPEI